MQSEKRETERQEQEMVMEMRLRQETRREERWTVNEIRDMRSSNQAR